MWFQTIKITKKRKYTKKDLNNLKKIVIFLCAWLAWLGFLWSIFIYAKYIKPLPSIKKLEEINIKESSTIYDKDWNQLYSLFWDEKRTYVPYEKISKNMVHAIIAWEDKTFFENPWIDFKWLLRAVFNYVTWKSDKIEWTSTISQQLIKIVFLSNERKLERKIKEAYLSYSMTKKYSKEKILELYLNKISFWSNAFWIEQAALTFFGKKSSELNFLESSILASIPKWPTYYSPYNHYTRLVWNIYTYPKWDENSVTNLIKKSDLEENSEIVWEFKNLISNLKATRLWENGILLCWIDKNQYKKTIKIDKDWCSIMNYSDLLWYLNSIRIENNWKFVEYQTWRKDFILWRMLEDNYITFDDYKKALLDSIWLEFKEYSENIKHPHFVMYVKEYLSNKYWEELLEEWWLKIYTTLDSKLQAKAEELVKKQAEANMAKFEANNAALISIDNASWDIIAYVWGADYFNKEIDGNVNMITSKRQPWSSFKPYVFALAIDKNPFGPHTPIYDLPTVFPGKYEPKNYNWKFSWKMTLMTALNHSRNIPAVKLYFLAWEQKGIIDYLKTIWVKSLDENFYYWAPLALWAWEMTPLEMVWAYSVFANMWNKVEINPIQKILDSKWLVIEEKKKSAWKKVLDEKTAYIMNYILSATYSRPDEFWNTNLSLKDRQAWAKTWTSNKLFVKNWKKEYFPGDLWTAWYTPQITTVVWVWNTNWKAIKANWDWLNWAAPIWKNFMEEAHKDKEKLTWKIPEWLSYTKISKISWLLAPEWFDSSLTVDSLFKNKPTKYDESLKEIKVDALCNGKVWPNTPASAIKTWYYIAFHSIDPTNEVWEAWVQKRAKETWLKEFSNIPNIITDYKDEECVRDENLVTNSNIEVRTKIESNETFVNGYNYIEIWYKSNNPIIKLQVLVWDQIIQEIKVDNKITWVYAWGINIPVWYDWSYKLTIRAIDNVYMSWEETKDINIVLKDTIWPEIILTNPEKDFISIYDDQFFNLRWSIRDRSKIKTINIYIDDKAYKMWIEAREFVEEINKDFSIPLWVHNIKIEAVDLFFNKSEKIVTFEVMKR